MENVICFSQSWMNPTYFCFGHYWQHLFQKPVCASSDLMVENSFLQNKTHQKSIETLFFYISPIIIFPFLSQH